MYQRIYEWNRWFCTRDGHGGRELVITVVVNSRPAKLLQHDPCHHHPKLQLVAGTSHLSAPVRCECDDNTLDLSLFQTEEETSNLHSWNEHAVEKYVYTCIAGQPAEILMSAWCNTCIFLSVYVTFCRSRSHVCVKHSIQQSLRHTVVALANTNLHHVWAVRRIMIVSHSL